MKKKDNMGKSLSVLAVVCLLLASGCALRPEPISKHNFGEVYVGTTAESPQVSWSNVSKNPLEVVGLLVLPMGGSFDMKATQPFQSFILQSGSSSKNFTFTFTPTQTGSASGDAVPQLVGSKARVQGLGLSGTGVYQIAKGGMAIGGGHMQAGQFLDFGSTVFPTGPPRRRRFNLINATKQRIQVDVIWSKGKQGFSVFQPTGPIIIPALGRVAVTLQFSPPGIGTFTDGVTFVDQANPKNKAGTAMQGKGTRAE